MDRPLRQKIGLFFDTMRKNAYGIRPYLVRDGKVHPVAILIPGGGYRRVCTTIEGRPLARELNAMGIHAVVLYYRVREKGRYPAPQEDLARAVRELFAKAKRWKLDMTGYSVWGASAGGHLAASFGTESMGWKHFDLPRPGAMVLLYPVVTMGEKAHQGSRDHLLGPDPSPETVYRTSVETQITEAYPPTFLWWGEDDDCVDPENSKMLMAALDANGVSCVCTEYKNTGHGVGLGKGLPCEGWLQKAVAFWEMYRK
ncbi:MAG: alpha/beta hydrolase [Eubacteriales bacterium]|nr:alpha/beta hydrolase [Eubacteriales bacterium]